MMTNADLVYEFHKAFGHAINESLSDKELVALRTTLINEEVREATEALAEGDKQQVAKELADILYVVYGAAISFGIDIDTVFAAVHASNMSKLGEDGKPVLRFDGKVLKGPNYREPNLSFVM